MTAVKMEPPINNVIAFGPGRDAPGPLIGTVRVFSMLDPSPNYPHARISLSHPDIGAVTMTCEQALGIAAQLADARSAVDAALDAVPFEPVTLTMATTCDCCGYAMPVGAEAVALSDDRRSDFYAHFGRCPMTWQTIKILVEPAANPELREVRALVFGIWAMHRPFAYRSPLDWSVTHIPSGRAVCYELRRETARKLVEMLGSACSSATFRELAPDVRTDAAFKVAAIVKEVTRG